MPQKSVMPAVPATAEADARAVPRVGGVPVVDSLKLLQGGHELLILHGGDCYRLRHTRNDKLILTK